MRVDVVTIFPDYFAPLKLSLIGKAIESGILDVGVHDLRDWTHDRHRTVDDTPYGGGAGMVMKPEPWGEALDALLSSYEDGGRPTSPRTLRSSENEADEPDDTEGRCDARHDGWKTGSATRGGMGVVPHFHHNTAHFSPPLLVVPSPAGTPFTQAMAQDFAARDWLAFACGRYEGIDARVVEHARTRMPVAEVSLGDYVLGGGEVAVLTILEAVVRLLPGVLGNPDSLVEESHAVDLDGLLEYPVYTKPATWRGLDVPAVLLSGNHGQVDAWRADQSRQRTARVRPDLLP